MRAADRLEAEIAALPRGARVLDVGCLGLSLYRRIKAARPDIACAGLDVAAPDAVPEDFEFRSADLESAAIPFDDDTFDLVVCQHVLEHVRNPVEVYGEMIRVARPGGRVFVEAPSDRSARYSMPRFHDWNLILSFYDDPTHTGRPWTPQALRRLALFHGCDDDGVAYETSWFDKLALPFRLALGVARRDADLIVSAWWWATGWVVFGVARKPTDLHGRPPFEYYSFKGVRPGNAR